MVTDAVAPPAWLAAAHTARAIVLPAPGGPVTVVMGPRAPRAMSRSIRGRGISHSGTPGTVTLDVRSGSPAPAAGRPWPAVASMAALVAIAIPLFPLRDPPAAIPPPHPPALPPPPPSPPP